MEDEPEGKGAKVWKELGCESSQLTMPPLTLVVPSTNQQANTTDSIASITQKRERSSSSARVDQWSMLGPGREDKNEEKDK